MATDVAAPSLVTPVMPRSFRAWLPSRPIARLSATLFLHDVAEQRVEDAGADGYEHVRGQVRAVFDDFIENGLPPRGLFKEIGGRTAICELVVPAPSPGARLIGAFVNGHCFVGLRLYWRDELPFKPTRQRGVIDYRTLVAAIVADWDMMLPGLERRRLKEYR